MIFLKKYVALFQLQTYFRISEIFLILRYLNELPWTVKFINCKMFEVFVYRKKPLQSAKLFFFVITKYSIYDFHEFIMKIAKCSYFGVFDILYQCRFQNFKPGLYNFNVFYVVCFSDVKRTIFKRFQKLIV